MSLEFERRVRSADEVRARSASARSIESELMLVGM